MARELRPCGTEAAYQRHLRHGEEPCEACDRAHAAYVRAAYHDNPARRAAKIAYSSARQRAMRRLAQRHHAEFRAILAEELEGDDS